MRPAAITGTTTTTTTTIALGATLCRITATTPTGTLPDHRDGERVPGAVIITITFSTVTIRCASDSRRMRRPCPRCSRRSAAR